MMLPSTGHFKAINCPFYDSGLCERPYCHFRHVKKDVSSSVETNGEMLQQLVSEAVKKVLQQKEVPSPTLVSKVVEELVPPAETPPSDNLSSKSFQPPAGVPSYKPTPIAELKKKRHIPVPYTPRNCSIVQAKRRKSSESTPPLKRAKLSVKTKPPVLSPSTEYIPEVDAKRCVGYNPSPVQAVTGDSVKPVLFLSSTIEYNPDIDTTKCVGYSPSPASNVDALNHSYIPSSIATLVAPTTDYVPAGSKDVYATYEPSVTKKAEPEYRPVCDAGSSVTSYIPTDKAMLEELNLDDFSSEFALLDEIISEHAANTLSSGQDVGGSAAVCVDKGSEGLDGESCVSVDLNHVNGDVPSGVGVNNPSVDINKNNSDKISKADKNSRSDKDRHRSKSKQHHSSSSSRHKSSSKSSTGDVKPVKADDVKKDRVKTNSKSKHSSKHKCSESSSKSAKRSRSTSKSDGSKPSSGDVKMGSSNSKSSSSNSKSSSSNSKSSSSNSKPSSSSSKRKSSSSSSDPKKKSKSSQRDKSRSSSTDHSKSKLLKPKEAPSVTSENDQHNSGDDDGDHFAADTLEAEMIESESDEDQITQECFRIFQEYAPNPVKAPSNVAKFEEKFLQEAATDPKPSSSKQRVAHEGTQYLLPKLSTSRRNVINPGQVMARRLESIKESYLLKKAADKEEYLQKLQAMKTPELFDDDGSSVAVQLEGKRAELPKSVQRKREAALSAVPPVTSGSKLRIAHVPNVNSLLEAKSRVKRTVLESKASSVAARRNLIQIQHSTVAQTVSVGSQRVAHTPSNKLLDRPLLIMEPGMVIPYSTRLRNFNHLKDEFMNTLAEPEAYKRAHEVETMCIRGAKTHATYMSVIARHILKHRQARGEGSIVNTSGTICHSDMLGHKPTYTSKTATNKVEPTLYDKLVKFILTEDELKENGFPLPDPLKMGSAISTSRYDKTKMCGPNERVCDNCRQYFKVNEAGYQLDTDNQCLYHSGRFQKRGESYSCCGSGINSTGCETTLWHVSSDYRLSNFGYVSTLSREPPSQNCDRDYGVYALDCEMVYTTKGMELARVTVVDRLFNTIYDTLVKPENPILDYSTKFSGITEADLKNVTTTIRDVQAIMLTMVKDKTILIGHSLDSDLRALKVIHRTVVDTSVLMPHNIFGNKKGLKRLAYEFLQLNIQQGTDGHDSAEDAITAFKLVLHHISQL